MITPTILLDSLLFSWHKHLLQSSKWMKSKWYSGCNIERHPECDVGVNRLQRCGRKHWWETRNTTIWPLTASASPWDPNLIHPNNPYSHQSASVIPVQPQQPSQTQTSLALRILSPSAPLLLLCTTSLPTNDKVMCQGDLEVFLL